MLAWYVGEFIVSSININTCVKEPTRGYQHCNTTQIFGRYIKVRESIYTQVIVIIRNRYHIDTRVILCRFE